MEKYVTILRLKYITYLNIRWLLKFMTYFNQDIGCLNKFI